MASIRGKADGGSIEGKEACEESLLLLVLNGRKPEIVPLRHLVVLDDSCPTPTSGRQAFRSLTKI